MTLDWKPTTWGELANLEYGKGLTGYENASGDYPVYGTNGKIGWHTEPLFNKAGVIIGRKGAYRGVHYSKTPFFVIDTAFYLKPKVELDLRWAYYQLLTQDINGMDSGSAIPSTSRPDFYALPVKLPSIPEQRAIVDVLGSLDDKIELNRCMNTTLEAMAKALFKSWFVDFDPVRAKAEYRQPYGMDAETAALFPDDFEESPLGEIPRGWKVRTLDGIAKYLNGLALQKFPPKCDDYLPVIKIAQLRKNSTEYADKASTNLDPDYIVDDGDVLFSWSGSLEVVIWCGGKGALNQHLFKVTSDIYPKWFYYLWTKHHLADFQQIAAGKATTMGHIQRHHLKQALTLVPPKRTLHWMTEQISPMIDLYIKNAVQSRNLAAMRDGLLPRLMRGEVRVRV